MDQNNQSAPLNSSGSHFSSARQPPYSRVGGQSNNYQGSFYHIIPPNYNYNHLNVFPPPALPLPYPYHYPYPPFYNPYNVYNTTTIPESFVNFNDDEPLPDRPATTALPSTGLIKNVGIETFMEYPAVAASDSSSSFSVLLGIHAPPLPTDENERVPIDLVAVLDVSGSMSGAKLSLLKSATKFVIDHMLPCDRLSIISFSTHATKILPLRRMTERGRKDAESAVDRLQVEGATNIVAGLNMGARVLEQRRQCNPVCSIIFVSDGQDTENSHGVYRPSLSKNGPPAYLRLLSASVSNSIIYNHEDRRERYPVYTFGVGMDHDAAAMNAIADGSCGTYSYVESAEMIPTSFARCIGGLFSVVAQDVRIMVLSASPGVEIKSIPSGRHVNEINSQRKQGIIHVGDLFAEEKKDFLVYLSVPVHSGDQMVTDDETNSKTPLLDIVCYYRNAFTGEAVQIDGPSIDILRPNILSPTDKVVNLKVDGQKNRVGVAESIAKAKVMADNGNLRGAKEVLSSSQQALKASASAQSGAEMVSWLEAELKEITARMESMELYDRNGRAFINAGMSAHNAQRATSRNYTFLQAAAAGPGAAFCGNGGSLSFASAGAGAAFDGGALSFASAGAACGAAYDTPLMGKFQKQAAAPRKDNGGWKK